MVEESSQSFFKVKLIFLLSISGVLAFGIVIFNWPASEEKLPIVSNRQLTSGKYDAEGKENLVTSIEREEKPLLDQCLEHFSELKQGLSIGLSVSESVIVESTSGKIRGSRSRLFGKEINTFLGIPFAEPPINGLRFRKTVPVKPWEGIKNATTFGPHCCQQIPELLQTNAKLLTNEYAEDCLFMNIWTPSLNGTDMRPIMFYVQGGAFDVGKVATEENEGHILSVVGNTVVVTHNYRLGSLGWLNLEIDECPGSQGLYDMATALQWVKNNARAFGGDPEKITLFGQSSGGMSIGFLMVSPTYGHLFNSAIFQSAPPIFPNMVFTYAEGAALGVAKQVGCDYSDENPDTVYDDPEKVLECLMKLPPKTFEKRKNGTSFGLDYFHLPSRNEDFPFSPYEGLVNGSYALHNIKQVMMGSNKDEGTIFLPSLFPEIFPFDGDMKLPNITTVPEFAKFVANELVKKLPQFKSMYPTIVFAVDFLVGKEPAEDTPRNLVFRALDKAARLAAVCPSKIMLDKFTQMGKTGYMYHFSQRSAYTKWASWMGVSHGDELQFVFGHPLRHPDKYSGDDIDLSKRMMKSWGNFARYETLDNDQSVKWTPYTVEKKEYMELNGKTAFMGSTDDSKLCELYDIAFNL